MNQSTMATPHNSTATSPTNPPFPQDLFPLDFLSFVESTSPSNNLNLGQPDFSFQSDAGPSLSGNNVNGIQQSHHSSPVFDFDTRSNAAATPDSTRGGSSRGRGGKKASKRGSISSQVGSRNGGQDSQRGVSGMEVDHQDGKNQGGMTEEAMRMAMAAQFGLQGMEGMEGLLDGYGQFTGLSQGMLQQFEGIHMQSPIVFDPNNPSQSYNPMAQFLAGSPHIQGGEARKMSSVNMVGGLITPGASGDMFPQIRQDQMMSPMQLEMLSRRDQMEAMQDLNMAPLLSPALNNNGSAFTSPSNNAAFYGQSSLEALQEQQRQFQEQLNALQIQQRQLQATAAAVAAQTSPFINSGGSSGQSRPVSTPGMMGGSTEPSPQYFSPLTSPALEATRQYNAFSSNRPPHPLSALSSPALNPMGFAGGAQQTLSPALNPQNGADLSDPDYLRALVGMLDPQIGTENGIMRLQSQQQQQQPYQSPHLYSSHQSSPLTPNQTGFTPLLPASGLSNGGSIPGAGQSGTGPHRQSLPAKSRPSPLVKPVNHRSHMRHPSTHTSFSQPSSPAILRGIQPGTYLPAAAMDNKGNQHLGGMGTGSLASTPSPVDLTSIMPPPPVPTAQKGLTPMTPAALMNLGAGAGGRKQVLPKAATQTTMNGNDGVSLGQAGASQVRGISRRVSSNGAGLPIASSSAGAAGTPAPAKKGAKAAGGKRLAAKVPGVGVRAATKGAAAAAALNVPVEGETRRTSHKAAEQKRRDSLKAGFDELRLLLPPINTEALDPESGEPIPGSSAPRLLPKSSLVPDDNPNRGVSKVALLKFSNEYIVKLHEKVDRRDKYLERLRTEVRRLRLGGEGEEGLMEDGQDLLEFDITLGEEEEEDGQEAEVDEEEEEQGDDDEEDEGMLEDDDLDGLDEVEEEVKPKKAGIMAGRSSAAGRKAGRRPAVGRRESSGNTVTGRARRGE